MMRIVTLFLLVACGGSERIANTPIKCANDSDCSQGFYCGEGICVAPAKPLGESLPLSSDELYSRVGQSEFDLDENNTQARQAVLFKVGIGVSHGFTLEDSLADAHFNMRFQGDQARMWGFAFTVPGKEVVVPPLPDEVDNPESRFLLKNIRIRLMGDAVAPINPADLPKASIDFKAPVVINADMGRNASAVFGVELHLEDVGIHVDLDVRARRLVAHVTINEQHLIFGQPDNLYIDGFSLDSDVEGMLLPSSWAANLPQ